VVSGLGRDGDDLDTARQNATRPFTLRARNDGLTQYQTASGPTTPSTSTEYYDATPFHRHNVWLSLGTTYSLRSAFSPSTASSWRASAP
jgi:hypothetical protein